MSIENVKKFYEDLSKDEKLKEKVKKFQINKDTTEQELLAGLVSIAEKLGYNFSEDELREYASNLEISDDMLEKVSGGSSFEDPNVIALSVFSLGLGAIVFGIIDGVNAAMRTKK